MNNNMNKIKFITLNKLNILVVKVIDNIKKLQIIKEWKNKNLGCISLY